ncbi:kynurenine formamidase [Rhodnius prolixus]|uniref:Putative kynurenine formamidase n=2 Tax=Rhodnius TaxID=13248 RepID=R4G805_RHOPR
MSTVDQQVNKQYSPRFWSKRLPEHEILERHIKFINSVPEKIKSEIPFISDLQYGEKPTNLVDIYGADLDKGSPIYVHLHGGYWKILSKNDSNYVVRPFWKAKIKTFIPDYDLTPKVSLEEIIQDVRVMAKYVFQMAIDNGVRSVWFGGHSAGGHLSACLLDEAWLSSLEPSYKAIFKGVFLISGLYDLLPLLKTEQNENLMLDSSRAVALSPAHNVHDLMKKSLLNKNFKVFIVAAEYDSPAFIEQSFNYAEKLKKVNMNVEYHLWPNVDHFDLAEQLYDETYDLSKKIISLIKENGKS